MIFIFVCEASSKYFEIRRKILDVLLQPKRSFLVSPTVFFFFKQYFQHKAQNKRNLTLAFQSSVLGIGEEPSELGKMAHMQTIQIGKGDLFRKYFK